LVVRPPKTSLGIGVGNICTVEALKFAAAPPGWGEKGATNYATSMVSLFLDAAAIDLWARLEPASELGSQAQHALRPTHQRLFLSWTSVL